MQNLKKHKTTISTCNIKIINKDEMDAVELKPIKKAYKITQTKYNCSPCREKVLYSCKVFIQLLFISVLQLP
jgi:hypothetical protein